MPRRDTSLPSMPRWACAHVLRHYHNTWHSATVYSLKRRLPQCGEHREELQTVFSVLAIPLSLDNILLVR